MAQLAKTRRKVQVRFPLTEKSPWEICRAANVREMDALAQRLEPKGAWDRFVAPAGRNESPERNRHAGQAIGIMFYLTIEVVIRSEMNRGFSISSLFRRRRQRPLSRRWLPVLRERARCTWYRIDLIRCGEHTFGDTEKNRRRLFERGVVRVSICFCDAAGRAVLQTQRSQHIHTATLANILDQLFASTIDRIAPWRLFATNMKKRAGHCVHANGCVSASTFRIPRWPDRRRWWEKVFLFSPDAKKKISLAPPHRDELDYEHLASLKSDRRPHSQRGVLTHSFRAAAVRFRTYDAVLVLDR